MEVDFAHDNGAVVRGVEVESGRILIDVADKGSDSSYYDNADGTAGGL